MAAASDEEKTARPSERSGARLDEPRLRTDSCNSITYARVGGWRSRTSAGRWSERSLPSAPSFDPGSSVVDPSGWGRPARRPRGGGAGAIGLARGRRRLGARALRSRARSRPSARCAASSGAPRRRRL